MNLDDAAFLKDLGHRIRARRLERGLTQAQLGDHCELHRTFIGSVERGERNLSILNLRMYLDEEREATGGVLPTDRQIVIERFRDELGDWRICVLSPFGARVHAPWALALEARVQDRLGLEVQAIWDDDGIVVRLPEADDSPPADAVILDPDEVEDLVVNAVGQSALFASRFRECAARALLHPRRDPGRRSPLWQQRQK